MTQSLALIGFAVAVAAVAVGVSYLINRNLPTQAQHIPERPYNPDADEWREEEIVLLYHLMDQPAATRRNTP